MEKSEKINKKTTSQLEADPPGIGEERSVSETVKQ